MNRLLKVAVILLDRDENILALRVLGAYQELDLGKFDDLSLALQKLKELRVKFDRLPGRRHPFPLEDLETVDYIHRKLVGLEPSLSDGGSVLHRSSRGRVNRVINQLKTLLDAKAAFIITDDWYRAIIYDLASAYENRYEEEQAA